MRERWFSKLFWSRLYSHSSARPPRLAEETVLTLGYRTPQASAPAEDDAAELKLGS